MRNLPRDSTAHCVPFPSRLPYQLAVTHRSRRHRIIALCMLCGMIVLAGCGAYAPPVEPLSSVEERRTALAIAGQPTLGPQAVIPTPQPRPTTPAVSELLAIAADDPRAVGDPNAPVVFVEFTDFECPFCSQFVQQTKPEIVSRYVESGQVRVVVRDLPLESIHPSAVAAAVAARCAGDQGQYFAMYDQLFSTHQIEWGGVPNRDTNVFSEFAAGLGLDVAAFDTCQADPAVAAEVRAEAAQAARLGLNATPSFFVNNQRVSGALGADVFVRLIEQELSR
ncbi:MAG: DsbA family protein [Oscillochloris sp.]|nr:DsbA family protein [Oscillochloris sp.]